MKIWADVSAVLKIAFICVFVGFLMGFCASGAQRMEPPRPSGSVTAM